MTDPAKLIDLITNAGAKAVELSQSTFHISEAPNMRDLRGDELPLGTYTQLRIEVLIPITVAQP